MSFNISTTSALVIASGRCSGRKARKPCSQLLKAGAADCAGKHWVSTSRFQRRKNVRELLAEHRDLLSVRTRVITLPCDMWDRCVKSWVCGRCSDLLCDLLTNPASPQICRLWAWATGSLVEPLARVLSGPWGEAGHSLVYGQDRLDADFCLCTEPPVCECSGWYLSDAIRSEPEEFGLTQSCKKEELAGGTPD